jgi:hypothetical protein
LNIEEDIRDKVHISSEDITGLNFIKDSGSYVFRKHYRQGLRSRIMEVLDSIDVRKERTGELIDGIRLFPRAKPLKMLRIFTNRFDCLENVLEEAKMFKIIEKYLSADHVAVSNEFVVDYIRSGKREIVLCGLQEYVEGEILDPWRFLHKEHLMELFKCMRGGQDGDRVWSLEELVQKAYENTDNLIRRLKKMILEANYIPDLSGVGNLVLTPAGNIKLVDINNISRVTFSDYISIDDRGYPVCDKSIEVISILEQKLLQRPIDMKETIYRTFLDPRRMRKVKALEKKFKSERE